MNKNKLTKDGKLCVLSICITIAFYGAERIIELFAPQGKTLGIALAMGGTVLLALTILILLKTKETGLGLLASILAYKMMPVSVSFLSNYSQSADALYFVVKKIGMLIFLFIIYRLYKEQEESKKISGVTIIAILFSVPFFGEISQKLADYSYNVTGSMMGGYISQFICYAAAAILVLIIADMSGYASLRFSMYYEAAALAVNILKTAARIGYRAINGAHISRSYFVWIALYLGLLFCFTAAVRIKGRKIAAKRKNEQQKSQDRKQN